MKKINSSMISFSKGDEQVKSKFWFTLVELIVVITILAVLWTIGFLSFQSYTVYSRDVTRLSNLNVLKSWLEIQYTKWGYFAEPDDYVNITASGTVIRKQWLFWKKALRTIKVNTDASKDPLTWEYYDYITDNNLSEYQIVWYMEWGETSYKTPLLSKEGLGVVQASWTWYTMKTKWQDLWVVFSWSVEVHKNMTIWSSLDIRNPDWELTIKFDEWDEVTSSTWSELFSNVYNRSKALLKNKNLAKLDDSLVLYFDMETLANDWKLKDLSWYWNHWELKWGIQVWNEVWQYWKATYFDWVDDKINIDKSNFLLLPTNNFTVLSYLKTTDSWGQRNIVSASYNGLTGFRFWYSGHYPYYLHWWYKEGAIVWSQKLTHNRYSYLAMKFELWDLITSYVNWNYYWIFDISSYNFWDKASLNQSQYLVVWGMIPGYSPTYIKWTIDELRIYNRALSEKEIKNIYGSTLK